jgi:hypothetical protein
MSGAVPRALLCLALLAACSDVVAPHGGVAPAAAYQKDLPPDGDTPEPDTTEWPEEFDQSPSIIEARVEAGFDGPIAYAQAYMRYFANRARQTVNLELQKGSRTVRPPAAVGYEEHLFPWVRELWTPVSIRLDSSCGYLANGWARHEAWHEVRAPGGTLAKWHGEGRSSAGSAQQPGCSGSGGGGGEPGGGESGTTCYYVDWYGFILWLDTGEVTYVGYLGTEMHCEPYHT